MTGLLRLGCVAAVLAAVLVAPARASFIVDRNVKHPTLKVDRHGRALVSTPGGTASA